MGESNSIMWRWEVTFALFWAICLMPVINELSLTVIGSAGLMWAIAWAYHHFQDQIPAWFKIILRLFLLLLSILLMISQLKGSFRLNDAIHFFVFLPILKNMELSEVRDRRIQILILALLWTAGLLLCEQLSWILASIVLCIVFAYLLAVSQSQRLIWRKIYLQQVALLVGLSVPIAMIFFILFPRLQFFGRIHWPQAKSGISSQIRPGDIAAMSLDDSVFANVLEEGIGNATTKQVQYWRYATLNQTEDGLLWSKSNPKIKRSQDFSLSVNAPEYYQVFYQSIGEGALIQREGTRLLTPIGRMNITAYRDGTFSSIYFQGKNPIYRAEWDNQAINDIPSAEDLYVPAIVATSLQKIVTDLKSDSLNTENLGRYFKENFAYTLSPGQYSSLQQFALEGKQGYCEHFAALAAVLLRSWQIPARVVVGFLINNSDDEKNYTILNSDAHAWVEYWDRNNKFWVRFDPTAYVSPERLLLSQQRWRQFRSSAQTDIAPFLHKGIWRHAFSWVRGMYLKSNLWLITYDRDEQRKVWRFENESALKMWGIVTLLLFLAIVLGLYFWRQSRKNINPVTAYWHQFLTKHFGVVMPTPEDWNALAHQKWANSDEFEKIVKYYCHLRYGRSSLPIQMQELQRIISAFHPIARSRAD